MHSIVNLRYLIFFYFFIFLFYYFFFTVAFYRDVIFLIFLKEKIFILEIRIKVIEKLTTSTTVRTAGDYITVSTYLFPIFIQDTKLLKTLIADFLKLMETKIFLQEACGKAVCELLNKVCEIFSILVKLKFLIIYLQSLLSQKSNIGNLKA